MPPVPIEGVRLIVHVGLMLLVGLIGGEIVARVRIPRVTGYLLAGLFISPSGIRLMESGEIRTLDLIAQLALGLIMFNIGGRFKASHIRRVGPKLLTVAIFEMGLTWALVGAAVYGLSRNFTLACAVGFIAMATAPATTLVVVKEYESEGPLTSNLIALVGINNFFCLALFPFLLIILTGSFAGFGEAIFEVTKSLALGALLGLCLSFMEERAHASNQQMLLGFCAIALVVGFAYQVGGSGPLAALVMGIVKVNSSSRGKSLFERVDAGAYPMYVLFFVIAGANLHMETLLHAGVMGVAYIVLRGIAKVFGAALGAYTAGLSKELRLYLGPAMISHAGVAVALAMIVGQTNLPEGHIVQAIVLGSIVVYEMIGPVVVRFSLVRCGEVKMVSLLPRLPNQSSIDNLEKIVAQTRRSLGLPMRRLRGRDEPIAAKHVMRSNVETVLHNTRFDEMLKFITHARYDLLPVVDGEGKYIGNISFPQIRDLIFDPALADLVIARDLLDSEPAYALPDDPLQTVLQKFHMMSDEVRHLPVLDGDEDPRVVGMIRQADVVDVIRRIRHEEKKRAGGADRNR